MSPDQDRQGGAGSAAELDFEPSVDTGDDFLNEIRHFVERANDSLTFDEVFSSERYINGDADICLKLSAGVDGEDFYAFVQAVPIRTANDRDAGALECTSADDSGLGFHSDGDEGLVLVGAGEFTHAPEQIIPATVWFPTANHVDGPGRKFLYFFLSGGFHEFVIAPGKGEIDILHIVETVRTCEGTGHMVKRGAKVVEDFTHKNVDHIGNRFDRTGENNVFPPARIILADNFVGFAVREGFDLGGEVIDMGVGPFNL